MKRKRVDRSVALVFPRLVQEQTMSANKFARLYARFAGATEYEPVSEDETIVLTTTVEVDVNYYADSDDETPDYDAYRYSLTIIGAAAFLLLHKEALEDGAPFITPARLGEFVERFEEVRQFVRLDLSGSQYAIVA